MIMDMVKDKYSAVWVSHSSIGNFLQCPRSYYLNNVYKDPDTSHKIVLMNPSLALGQTVHAVLEELSALPVEERFRDPLVDKYEMVWDMVSGEKGGFVNGKKEEQEYKERGIKMLKRVEENPGPLGKLAVKIKRDLPYYWLSEDDNIILCGKVDWLEYLPKTDSVHIIDFKTGKHMEKANSLQLPIYLLLVHNCQKRKVTKASYWYLAKSSELTSKRLPKPDTAYRKVLKIAKIIKQARKSAEYVCPKGEEGCFACRPLEAVLRKEAKFVGVDNYRQDVYILRRKQLESDEEIIH